MIAAAAKYCAPPHSSGKILHVDTLKSSATVIDGDPVVVAANVALHALGCGESSLVALMCMGLQQLSEAVLDDSGFQRHVNVAIGVGRKG